MSELVYQNEFIFDELDFFTNLLNKERVSEKDKEMILKMLNLENAVYRFRFEKDSSGSWYKKCFKNGEKISWNDIGNWLRPYVFDFERKNNIYNF